MRFRRQWMLGLGALVALIATTALTGIIALHVTGARANAVANDYAEDVARVERLRYLAERVVATSRGCFVDRRAFVARPVHSCARRAARCPC